MALLFIEDFIKKIPQDEIIIVRAAEAKHGQLLVGEILHRGNRKCLSYRYNGYEVLRVTTDKDAFGLPCFIIDIDYH